MIQVTPEVRAALAAESVNHTRLVELPGVLHTDSAFPVEWEGKTYLPTGLILRSTSSFSRTREINTNPTS